MIRLRMGFPWNLDDWSSFRRKSNCRSLDFARDDKACI
jgi:hypothetical protein